MGDDLYLAMGLGVGSALALGLGAPMWPLWLGLSCFSVVYLAMRDVALGACLVLILSPLLFFVRNASPESVVLAGARSEWMACLLVVWLIKVGYGEYSWPRCIDANILAMFLCYAIIMAVVAETLVSGALGLRAIATPACIYFVVRDATMRRPEASSWILRGVLASIGIIGLLSCFWYNGHLEMNALTLEGILPGGAGRNVLGYHFERLNSLIGGGPSNVGIFLSAGTVLCLGSLLTQGLLKWQRVCFMCLGAVLAYVSLLALSRSSVVLLMISLTAIAFARVSSSFVRTVLLSVVTLMLVGVVLGTVFADATLASAAQDDSEAWWDAMPTDLSTCVFGAGLNAAGGGLIPAKGRSDIPVDGGWPLLLSMVGAVGLAAIAAFLLALATAFFRLAFVSVPMTITKTDLVLGITAGAAAGGLLLASAHTAVMMRPAVDVAFFALAAVMISTYDRAQALGLNTFGSRFSA